MSDDSDDLNSITALPNLCNAAREFIAERIHTIEADSFGDYTEEDLTSAQREEQQIEAEITQLRALLTAVAQIEGMRHPSIATLLRQQGYAYEATQIEALVAATQAITAIEIV
ncbi:hypothetical protein [Ottowia testudinis]|uniref:Uncharacterized protein n=1 Tax=Ottowia testudinis TaxID=2816950 RepID=A0A975H392_9BURK|nr:hypothetical protein [Ottowia testudinis]QTD44986.1 hypothetical protein J1M35_18375 [Ottowia testudinis]